MQERDAGEGKLRVAVCYLVSGNKLEKKNKWGHVQNAV